MRHETLTTALLPSLDISLTELFVGAVHEPPLQRQERVVTR